MFSGDSAPGMYCCMSANARYNCAVSKVGSSSTAVLKHSTAAGYSALLNAWTPLFNWTRAWEQTDIAVTGLGMLDGQADKTHWWDWKGRDSSRALVAMAEKDVPVAERIF